jgi:hypothetical protein
MELDSISHTWRVHWEADEVEPFAPGQVLLQLDVDSGGRRFHLAVSEARRAASVLHSSSVRGPAARRNYTRRHVPGSRAPGTCAGRWRGRRRMWRREIATATLWGARLAGGCGRGPCWR